MSTNKVRIDESVASANIADIVTETLANGTQIPVSKIHLGASNLDGGAVTPSNPFPVTVTNQPLSYEVTGTFWQTEQPISGTVAISNFPGTQAVSGTFWQAEQPVSIALPVAVTGTFWQATQPVSLASLPALPTGTNAIGGVTEVLRSPVAGSGQAVAVGATSAQSTAITGTVVDITITTACWMEIHATNPVAAKPTSYPLMATTLPYRFPIPTGYRIAFIRDAVDGFAYINVVS